MGDFQEQQQIRELMMQFMRWQDNTLLYAFTHSRRVPAYSRNPDDMIPLVKAETEKLFSRFRGNRPATADMKLNDLHLLYSSTLERAQEIYEGKP